MCMYKPCMTGLEKARTWFASEERRRHWLTWKTTPHMKTSCPKTLFWFDLRLLRRYFVEHSYHDGGVLNHILDDGKLVNHSDTPNAGAGEGLLTRLWCSRWHQSLVTALALVMALVLALSISIQKPKYLPGSEPFSTYALRDIKEGEEVRNNLNNNISS